MILISVFLKEYLSLCLCYCFLKRRKIKTRVVILLHIDIFHVYCIAQIVRIFFFFFKLSLKSDCLVSNSSSLDKLFFSVSSFPYLSNGYNNST